MESTAQFLSSPCFFESMPQHLVLAPLTKAWDFEQLESRKFDKETERDERAAAGMRRHTGQRNWPQNYGSWSWDKGEEIGEERRREERSSRQLNILYAADFTQAQAGQSKREMLQFIFYCIDLTAMFSCWCFRFAFKVISTLVVLWLLTDSSLFVVTLLIIVF